MTLPNLNRFKHFTFLLSAEFPTLRLYPSLFDIISTQLLESELSKTRKNLIKPDIQEDPYTKITFEDGQVLNLKTEKLEYDYMAYIVVRELAERAMIAQSSEETKV